MYELCILQFQRSAATKTIEKMAKGELQSAFTSLYEVCILQFQRSAATKTLEEAAKGGLQSAFTSLYERCMKFVFSSSKKVQRRRHWRRRQKEDCNPHLHLCKKDSRNA
ncbi:hypothetical protein AVEN_19770-1 [Araneus ventricosus]|uniref:Uncharacterized protein n=1 Tax=Araneus ventricosus TaxID=182803 RepID=A0A4Y2LFC8_ARAVE|nr:hypothetical protein AVEN_10592-1 [Araneus ventricosus]GBN13416.1 hypothetical protein AVEN_19770-1 [Araneus ventricosus]